VISAGRQHPAWWLLAALTLAAGATPASADETVYNQDGYKLVLAVHGAFGGYAADNIDFGAGNVNSRAPREGPFEPSLRRSSRQWFESFARPFAEAEAPFFGLGHLYGLVSIDGGLTRGSGDALSSLAPQGARSTTSDNPAHAELEDAAIGWHSVALFADRLGDDAIDISVGQQSFILGDAFLVGSGVANGFGRAALNLQPHTSFGHTAILRFNAEPVRLQAFNLESRTDQTLMRGFDQPKTKFAGFDLALFKGGETGATRKTACEKEVTQAVQETAATREKKEVPDRWSAGFEFLHVYDADSTPETFSFPPDEASPTLSINGNRNGLNVFSGYLHGAFIEQVPDLAFHSQFVLQRNDAVDRRVNAEAWYVEPEYRFSTLPWTPQINLRYAHFSGDANPNDRVKRSYDPLFTSSGDRGFGSWTLGEVFGQWVSPNSNLNVEMVKLSLSPLPDLLDVGALYYNFDFDRVRQFNDPRITAGHAGDEFDLYAKWSPYDWLGVTGVFGFVVPGAGLRQAAHAFVADNGPEGRGVGRTMTLAEFIVEIKF
jgi:hypothetical protein